MKGYENLNPKEKYNLIKDVVREATNDQRASIGLPPIRSGLRATHKFSIVIGLVIVLYFLLLLLPSAKPEPTAQMCIVPTTTVMLECTATDEEITQALKNAGYKDLCYGTAC
jgi:hypothetical protein